MIRHIAYRDWRSGADFDDGTHDGTTVLDGCLVLENAVDVREYADPHRDGPPETFEQARWVSPEVDPGFAVTELVASWNASTPEGTWLEVEVAGTAEDGTRSKWYVMGRWAETDVDIMPTSVRGQGDPFADVAADLLTTRAGRTLSSYQLRITLLRRPGLSATPAVRLAGVMASQVPMGVPVPASPSGGAEGMEIDVPAYSQEIHLGEYPQWDGGGEAWCSPTSTSMILAHWGVGPSPADYSWVDERYQDRWVDHAARHTYDYSYDGAGNWSFNTAYAARFGMVAFVTRLRSLTEVEAFIKVGIPLVVSVSFREHELEGAGYDTHGHLLTVIGFTEDGDVISNDPASHMLASNEEVRTVYGREQFENAWLPTSGGIVYVIHPPGVPLPTPPAEANW